MRAVGDKRPVEPLPHLLVGPGSRRREETGERQRDDGRREPPERRGPRCCGSGGGHRIACGRRGARAGGRAVRPRRAGLRRAVDGGESEICGWRVGVGGSLLFLAAGRGESRGEEREIGWRGGVVVRSREHEAAASGGRGVRVAARRDGPGGYARGVVRARRGYRGSRGRRAGGTAGAGPTGQWFRFPHTSRHAAFQLHQVSEFDRGFRIRHVTRTASLNFLAVWLQACGVSFL